MSFAFLENKLTLKLNLHDVEYILPQYFQQEIMCCIAIQHCTNMN